MRTNAASTLSPFVADPHSLVRTGGSIVDWANVPASFVDAGTGKKVLPAGTAVAETAAGLVPRDGTNAATGLLASDATEGLASDARTGYGVLKGGAVYGNLLPDAGDAAFATIQTELKAAGPFVFLTYADSRA